MKKFIIHLLSYAILFLVLLFAILFISGRKVKPQTFSANGLSITLTEDFENSGYSSYSAAYASDDVFAVTLKEDFVYFEALPASLTEYAEILRDANNLDADITENDGLVYYTYDIYDIDTQELYRIFYVFVYQTDDAFWSVQFAVNADANEKQRENIFTYAKSVCFE